MRGSFLLGAYALSNLRNPERIILDEVLHNLSLIGRGTSLVLDDYYSSVGTKRGVYLIIISGISYRRQVFRYLSMQNMACGVTIMSFDAEEFKLLRKGEVKERRGSLPRYLNTIQVPFPPNTNIKSSSIYLKALTALCSTELH